MEPGELHEGLEEELYRECYMKLGHIESAAQSTANYGKDVKVSRTHKRRRYVMLHVIICLLSRYSLRPPSNSPF